MAADLAFYLGAVAAGQLPPGRGVVLTQADQMRRTVIQELMCHFQWSKVAIARRYGLDFDHHFAKEIQALRPLQADGLVHPTPTEIFVTPPGRLLIRNIAAVFDTYLRAKHQATPIQAAPQFSQSI